MRLLVVLWCDFRGRGRGLGMVGEWWGGVDGTEVEGCVRFFSLLSQEKYKSAQTKTN